MTPGGPAAGQDADPGRPPEPSRPEQIFFKDPAIDRVLGFAMALAGEVYVLRDRVRLLERLLAERGVLAPGALDQPVATPESAAVDAADRDDFVRHLMQNLLGLQQSKGPI